MTTINPNLTAEEAAAKFKEWSQIQYVKISKYCMSKGYQIKTVEQKRCGLLPPLLGVWYVKTTEKNADLWVLSGDFPTDIASAHIAKDAREALRYFSMTWHMQAAKLEDGVAEGKIDMVDAETQDKFAKDLTKRAEDLYALHSDDNLWKDAGL